MLRRIFKKVTYLFVVIVSFSILLSFVPTVQARDLNEEVCEPGFVTSADKPVFCNDVSTGNPIFGPDGIITRITQGFVYAAGAISVIVMVVGGIRYALSAGDPNGTKGAKDSILYAAVGLAVALFAQGIIAFVLSKL